MNNEYKPDIHHRRSVRLKEYDYSQEGMYFITICVQNHECLFGKITDGEMILNNIGEIVCDEWLKTAELRRNVQLHEFVVMPNHFHGILEITKHIDNHGGACTGVACNAPIVHSGVACNPPIVHSGGARNAPTQKNAHMSSISPKSNEMGTIIRAFKSAVTKNIHNSGHEFAWQRNMWEHVIRDAADYARIADYIINNPFRWQGDVFHKE
jgi:REP element-mobilizing transposase RayT